MNRSNSMGGRDRSFDSIVSKIWRLRKQNHESLRTAMYNLMYVGGLSAFIGLCVMMGPFVKPLLWAFLMGAVLFPFKRKLAELLNGWFDRLEERDSNVFISMLTAPFEVSNYVGSLLINWLCEHWQPLVALSGVTVCIKMLALYAPKDFLFALWCGILYSHSLFVKLIGYLNTYLLIAIISVYLTSVYFFWKEENRARFVVAGQSLWIAIVGYACSFLGALQVPVFLLVMVYVGVCSVYQLKMKNGSSSLVEKIKHLMDKSYFEKGIASVHEKIQSLQSEVDDISISENTESPEDIKETDEKENRRGSDLYFKLLLYACVATFLYRNVWIFLLLALPLIVHLLFTLGETSGINSFIYTKIFNIYLQIRAWAFEHHSAVLPLCLPGVLEITYKINTYIRNFFKSSVDIVTSILMIILMLLLIAFLGIFFCVNIYSETIEVAYLGKDVINKTITERPELIDILPANMQESIEEALDNAHHYGRRKIETYIDDWLADADVVHATKLKNQILDVWDRLIQYWIDFNKSDSTYGPRVPTEALKTTFGEIVDNPGHFKELVLVAKQGFIGWAKSNTQTILEVAESLWHIIRTNLSVIMTFTGEILSLIFLGGQACVQFILDMIVFFTALFYLLSNSHEKYVPLQVFKYLGFGTSGNKITEALENSISSVLISMFKCSLFTGLFTWLLHTWMGARIVFLPSALAAMMSAAPFLSSYWCALPAVLEIWLAQGRFYSALAMMALQYLVPTYFEAEIYAEMKSGGHPYLTALAIAGGMYWMGWQGAILGPLMLCLSIGFFEVIAMHSNEDPRRSSDEDTRTTFNKTTTVNKEVMKPIVEVNNAEITPHIKPTFQSSGYLSEPSNEERNAHSNKIKQEMSGFHEKDEEIGKSGKSSGDYVPTSEQNNENKLGENNFIETKPDDNAVVLEKINLKIIATTLTPNTI